MAIDQKGLYRVVDANFNRAKEGLRVCEDISRFILDRKIETKQYKEMRHALTEIICSLSLSKIIKSRDIDNDVGKSSILTELKRKEVKDIFYANSQRIKESLRVLEEFSKLINKTMSLELKRIRYKIYAIEKKLIEKV